MEFSISLPIVFAGLMALSFLIYALLDGFDLGVGLMLPWAAEGERDLMIASIGPFWDANETWLVLGVGLLLIAFPAAHSQILGSLYLDVLVLLVGLILRGVAFDFRAKVPLERKQLWDRMFFLGSLLATLAQGYMLGKFVVGFDDAPLAEAFAFLSAVCVTSAYALIGGSWLIMKTDGDLQRAAARWTRRCLWLTMAGIFAVSIVNPLVSEEVFARWFGLPQIILLLPIPILCAVLMIGIAIYLGHFERRTATGGATYDWIPFAATTLLFVLCFQGLAYSFYPFIVPFEMTFYEAAAADESLEFVFWGVAFVFPVILAYTVMSYRVFWGKAEPLTYH